MAKVTVFEYEEGCLAVILFNIECILKSSHMNVPLEIWIILINIAVMKVSKHQQHFVLLSVSVLFQSVYDINCLTDTVIEFYYLNIYSNIE